MNRTFITVVGLLVFGFAAAAQDDLPESMKVLGDAADAVAEAPKVEEEKPKVTYWKKSIMTKADFGHTSLTNWAAGGYNTLSLKSFIDANANYQKDAMYWNNRLQLDYGFLYSADKPVLQKSDDRIYLESKWGHQATKNLYYSAQFNFRSQFSNTYDYPTPGSKADGSAFADGETPSAADWKRVRTLKSGIFSPAYTNIALGIDYKPLNWLTVNFAPLTGGFVIVENPQLRAAYGQPLRKKFEDVETLPTDDAGKVLGTVYQAAKFEFGAQLKVDFKVNVNDNFAFSSQLVLFSDYLDDPQNLRVNWDNRIDWKLTKFFSLTLTTNLIYDDNVMITTEKDPVAKQRIQFKESLSFGFVYTFAR